MNYIVFDLEATCWQGERHGPSETIEIGAILINEQKEIVGEFEQFIKPLKYPNLSDFCTELTSIEQKDVDHAPYFAEAVEKFKSWFGYPDEEYVLCSWGFYDKKQFESDCRTHGISSDWVNKHISLKHQHGKLLNLRRPMGMKGALRKEGFELDGTHHRGIDDARNIAKIFLRHFDRWNF